MKHKAQTIQVNSFVVVDSSSACLFYFSLQRYIEQSVRVWLGLFLCVYVTNSKTRMGVAPCCQEHQCGGKPAKPPVSPSLSFFAAVLRSLPGKQNTKKSFF